MSTPDRWQPDFLAPGVEPSDIPALAPLLRAAPILDAFLTLFRGTEAEVLLRLTLLRELGSDTEHTRHAPEALRARFAWADSVKLETALKRLRENALLDIGEDGCYSITSTGRNAVAALGMLTSFDEEEDAELGFLTAQLAGLNAVGELGADALNHLLAKLNELTHHFEEAIASGSEFRIRAARRRLSANEKWLARGTELLHELFAAPDIPFEAARIAQRIGLAQSRLARVDASFQRALNKIETQRVTLGTSGISSSDVAAWLRTLGRPEIAALIHGATHAIPAPSFLAGAHELADRAEAVLCDAPRTADEPTPALPPPAETEPQARPPQDENLPLLLHLTERLQTLGSDPIPLAQAITGHGFADAAWRLSMLALIAERHDAPAQTDDPVDALLHLPLQVEFTTELDIIHAHGIEQVTHGHVTRNTESE